MLPLYICSYFKSDLIVESVITMDAGLDPLTSEWSEILYGTLI